MSFISNYIHHPLIAGAQAPFLITMDELDGNAMIQALQRGDSHVLDEVYKRYREEFIGWSSRQFKNMDREDFLDAWQETIIAFYDQVISHRLTSLTCELKTYLFIIGKRYIIKQVQKSNRVDYVDPQDHTLDLLSDQVTFNWEDPYEDQKQLVTQAMTLLGEQCKTILLMRFAEGVSVPAIMVRASYPNVNTVSATLSRCLRKLKDMIQVKLQSGQHA